MTLDDQRAFIWSVAPGVAMLLCTYVLITAFRKFKDFFPAELFAAMLLGSRETMPSPSVFFWTETPAAILSALVLASLIRVKDNARAILIMLGIQALGGCLMIGSTVLFEAGYLSPSGWWAALSVAIYTSYTCTGTAIYDRYRSQ